MLPFCANARDLSDLYFLPLQGEFVGQTTVALTSTELKGTYLATDISLKSDETLLSQSFGYGILDWFTISLEAPYSLGGESTTDLGVTAPVTSDIDSEPLGARLNASFLFIDVPENGLKLGLDLFYLPKSFNDRDLGYYGASLRTAGNFTEKTSWSISTTFQQYEKTDTIKELSIHSTAAIIQHKVSDIFFIRPGLLLVNESKTDPTDDSFEIIYKPRFGYSLVFGGTPTPNLLWLVSSQYLKGTGDYYEPGASFAVDVSSFVLGASLGYRF